MTRALYDTGRNAFLTKKVDWLNDTIKAALVVTGVGHYGFDASHQYFSSIAAADVLATVALANMTASAGVADADDATFSSVPNTGSYGGAVVIYQDTGVSSSSQLIAYMDDLTGLPILPNGGDIALTFDNGADKIFKL